MSLRKIDTRRDAWEDKGDSEAVRTMVKFIIPTQESNPPVEDGSIGQKMGTVLDKPQPEAAYFCRVDGKRGGFILVDLEEESEVVTKLEPCG
jgi:hypothetical protein